MATQYYSCEYQGISPGWSDNYNIGLPCQWIDVTGWAAANTTLGTNVNPLGWLCEGNLDVDASGEPIWLHSGHKTDNQWPSEHRNKDIDIKKCTTTSGATNNNKVSVPISLPSNGQGYLTSSCLETGQTFGPKRDCEFKQRTPYDSCTPGATLSFSCKITSTSQPQVLRVCEASTVIGAGTACRYMDPSLLANIVVLPTQTSNFTVQCPVARSYGEVGGKYSTYSGPLMNGMDASATITCTVVSGAPPLILNGGFENNSTKYCGGNANTRCSGLTDSSLIAPWYLSGGASFEMDFTSTSFSFTGGWSLYLRDNVAVSQNVSGLVPNRKYTITFQVAQLPQDSDDDTCLDSKIGLISATTNGDSNALFKIFNHDSTSLLSPYAVMNVSYSFTPYAKFSIIQVLGVDSGNCGFLVDNFIMK